MKRWAKTASSQNLREMWANRMQAERHPLGELAITVAVDLEDPIRPYRMGNGRPGLRSEHRHRSPGGPRRFVAGRPRHRPKAT